MIRCTFRQQVNTFVLPANLCFVRAGVLITITYEVPSFILQLLWVYVTVRSRN